MCWVHWLLPCNQYLVIENITDRRLPTTLLSSVDSDWIKWPDYSCRVSCTNHHITLLLPWYTACLWKVLQSDSRTQHHLSPEQTFGLQEGTAMMTLFVQLKSMLISLTCNQTDFWWCIPSKLAVMRASWLYTQHITGCLKKCLQGWTFPNSFSQSRLTPSMWTLSQYLASSQSVLHTYVATCAAQEWVSHLTFVDRCFSRLGRG